MKMKKKLSLGKDTLRTLGGRALGRVAGGDTTTGGSGGDTTVADQTLTCHYTLGKGPCTEPPSDLQCPPDLSKACTTQK